MPATIKTWNTHLGDTLEAALPKGWRVVNLDVQHTEHKDAFTITTTIIPLNYRGSNPPRIKI